MIENMEETSRSEAKPVSPRISSFEILRIIAMLFIIAHHFAVHGGFNFATLERTPITVINEYYIGLIASLGKAGVNLFVLISAFFMIDNTRFKTKKMFSLAIMACIFSVIIALAFLPFQRNLDIRAVLFPTGMETWWFLTAYLLLYLISPILNRGVRALKKEAHLFLAIAFIVLWSVCYTFLSVGYEFTYFGWFICLYLIGSFIRIYDVKLPVRPLYGILIACGIFLVWYSLGYGLDFLIDGRNGWTETLMRWFSLGEERNFLQLICSVLLFLSFKEIRMRNFKAINIIASTTLAVYMVHDHPYMRDLIWQRILRVRAYATSPALIPYSLGCVLSIFFVGMVVGLAYRYSILGVGIDKGLNWFDRKCLHRIDASFNQ